MKVCDFEFRKTQFYDPFNPRAEKGGIVIEWIAYSNWGNVIASGRTRGECEADARMHIFRNSN